MNPAASPANLVTVWKTAYRWPKPEGFFNDFGGAYNALFGPAAFGTFQWYAVAAGIVH